MKKILVFYGYKGSGKDTCFECMRLEANAFKLSFADKLRFVVWFLFEEKIKDAERIYGTIDKKEEPIEGWEILEKIRKDCGFEEKLWTGRRLLQWMGTDVCRSIYGSIWVDKLIRDIKTNTAQTICITDCRFKNEYDALKELDSKEYDVKFVLVDRDSSDNEFSTHASEKDIKDFVPDITIKNDKTVMELKEKVLSLL